MSHLKAVINSVMQTGELSRKMGYTHRNAVNYRIRNPRTLTLGFLDDLSDALEVSRKKLIDAADLDIAEMKSKRRRAKR